MERLGVIIDSVIVSAGELTVEVSLRLEKIAGLSLTFCSS